MWSDTASEDSEERIEEDEGPESLKTLQTNISAAISKAFEN
jgi:hypothetical protein